MKNDQLKHSLRVIFEEKDVEPLLLRNMPETVYQEKLEELRKKGYELREERTYKCHRLMETTMLHVWQASQQKQDP